MGQEKTQELSFDTVSAAEYEQHICQLDNDSQRHYDNLTCLMTTDRKAGVCVNKNGTFIHVFSEKGDEHAKTIIKKALDLGCSRTNIKPNQRTIKLYEQMGFKLLARTPSRAFLMHRDAIKTTI